MILMGNMIAISMAMLRVMFREIAIQKIRQCGLEKSVSIGSASGINEGMCGPP